jgi:hypothetical protein
MKNLFRISLILFCIFFAQKIQAAETKIAAPSSFKNIFQNSALIGSAKLRFLGKKVYDIALWSEDGKFSYDKKFAIHIKYNMNFTREDLAERSISEIKKLHELTAEEEKNYINQLTKIFDSVKKGDEKVAIFIPSKGVMLFHNDKLSGTISDLKFARFFVDIWLDENGSYPKITKKLLGKN